MVCLEGQLVPEVHLHLGGLVENPTGVRLVGLEPYSCIHDDVFILFINWCIHGACHIYLSHDI